MQSTYDPSAQIQNNCIQMFLIDHIHCGVLGVFYYTAHRLLKGFHSNQVASRTKTFRCIYDPLVCECEQHGLWLIFFPIFNSVMQ